MLGLPEISRANSKMDFYNKRAEIGPSLQLRKEIASAARADIHNAMEREFQNL